MVLADGSEFANFEDGECESHARYSTRKKCMDTVEKPALIKKISLILGIQIGAVAKSYMRKGFLIYEIMLKYLVIY
jgi:hypothetical protein